MNDEAKCFIAAIIGATVVLTSIAWGAYFYNVRALDAERALVESGYEQVYAKREVNEGQAVWRKRADAKVEEPK